MCMRGWVCAFETILLKHEFFKTQKKSLTYKSSVFEQGSRTRPGTSVWAIHSSNVSEESYVDLQSVLIFVISVLKWTFKQLFWIRNNCCTILSRNTRCICRCHPFTHRVATRVNTQRHGGDLFRRLSHKHFHWRCFVACYVKHIIICLPISIFFCLLFLQRSVFGFTIGYANRRNLRKVPILFCFVKAKNLSCANGGKISLN